KSQEFQFSSVRMLTASCGSGKKASKRPDWWGPRSGGASGTSVAPRVRPAASVRTIRIWILLALPIPVLATDPITRSRPSEVISWEFSTNWRLARATSLKRSRRGGSGIPRRPDDRAPRSGGVTSLVEARTRVSDPGAAEAGAASDLVSGGAASVRAWARRTSPHPPKRARIRIGIRIQEPEETDAADALTGESVEAPSCAP